MSKLLRTNPSTPLKRCPTDNPGIGCLLSIHEVYDILLPLLDSRFTNVGKDQERGRGSVLHKLVSQALGYKEHKEDGQFPDIKEQLLEVKLQTSPTIDLGLVSPGSEDPLDMPKIGGVQVRHCDVRYVIFFAKLESTDVVLTNLFLTTGQDFYKRFPQFGGKVVNRKLQIPLPPDFFGHVEGAEDKHIQLGL